MRIFTKLSILFKYGEKYEAYLAGYEECKRQQAKKASRIANALLESAKQLGITIGIERVYAKHPFLKEYEARIQEYDERAQAYIEEQLKPPLLTPRLVATRAGFPTRQISGILPLLSTGELPKPPVSGPHVDPWWQSSQPHEVVWSPIITDEAAQPQQVLDGEPTETSLLVRLRHEK